MKIDGIDPLLLNRIQEQAQRQQVDETDRSQTDERVSRQGAQKENTETLTGQEKDLPEKLEEALRKLNDTTEALDLDLEFRAREDTETENRQKVEIRDLQQDETLKEIEPEEAINMVAQVQSLVGVLLDVRR